MTPNNNPPSRVSKADLARLHALADLAWEHSALRDRVVSALDLGAVPEPGDMLVDFPATEEHLLTARKLADALALTHGQIQELRAGVPPTRFRHLRAHECRVP